MLDADVLAPLARSPPDWATLTALGELQRAVADNTAAQHAARDQGVLRLLLRLLQDGHAKANVLRSACAALCALSSGNRANQDALFDSGGLEVLLALLGSEQTAGAACTALACAVTSHIANQTAAHWGAIGPLVSICQFGRDAHTRLRALAAIVALVDHPPAREAVVAPSASGSAVAYVGPSVASVVASPLWSIA